MMPIQGAVMAARHRALLKLAGTAQVDRFTPVIGVWQSAAMVVELVTSSAM